MSQTKVKFRLDLVSKNCGGVKPDINVDL